MRTEDIKEFDRIHNDSNFTSVDPFAEYLSGVSDDELYVLLTGLEMVGDMDDIWLVGIDRTPTLVAIAQGEFINRELDRTYLRYLERQIREDLDFGSTPIKLRVRKRS